MENKLAKGIIFNWQFKENLQETVITVIESI